MKTFKCTFVDGSTATLKDETRLAAQKRFAQIGRGVKVKSVKEVSASQHQVWGKDEDDNYEDGE